MAETWLIMRLAQLGSPQMYWTPGPWDLNIHAGYKFNTEDDALAMLRICLAAHPDERAVVVNTEDLVQEMAEASAVYDPMPGAHDAEDPNAFAALLASLDKGEL